MESVGPVPSGRMSWYLFMKFEDATKRDESLKCPVPHLGMYDPNDKSVLTLIKPFFKGCEEWIKLAVHQCSIDTQ